MADVLDEIEAVETFLRLISEGSAEYTAMLAVNWTPIKLRKLKQDAEFVGLMADAYEGFLDGVETAVNERALAGNRWAVEMVLYNKRPQFWRPPAHKIAIQTDTHVTVEVIRTAVDAAKEFLLEPGAIAALQRGAIDADSRDAN